MAHKTSISATAASTSPGSFGAQRHINWRDGFVVELHANARSLNGALFFDVIVGVIHNGRMTQLGYYCRLMTFICVGNISHIAPDAGYCDKDRDNVLVEEAQKYLFPVP